MERDEEGYCRVHLEMCHLSIGKGGPPAANWIVATVGNTSVEMGVYLNEFYHGIADVAKWS